MLFASLLLSTVTITLPAEATVSGAEITLGEIATLRGDDPAEVARLAGLSLGYAPAPGYTRVFPQWKIESLARQQVAGLEVELAGEIACRVAPTTAVVTAAELGETARAALAELLTGQDVEIGLAEELQDELVPKGRVGVALEPLAGQASMSSSRSRGRWSVPVQILVDDMPYRTVWVPFEVVVYRVVPVLVRDVPRGAKIGREDIVERRCALASVEGQSLLSAIELDGATARRQLSKDQPVGPNDVARVVAVQKGETVNLTVVNGTIVVKTNVITLQDGYVGDVIHIRVPTSEKELTAKVVGTGQVRIELSNPQ